MKKKKIYIIGKNSRAAAYGIGTYISQLTDCLKQAPVEFGLINMHSQGNEVTIEQKDGYDQISLPSLNVRGTKGYYSRNAAYLLREIIAIEPDRNIIFHLNYMGDEKLVYYLKKLFKCKVILTVHYTNWSFELLGNGVKLRDIMGRKRKLLDVKEMSIRKQFEEDLRMIKKSDRVVYIAEHSAKAFSKYLKNKNISIINNGLKDVYKKLSPEEICFLREKNSINPISRIILFAGRLDGVKGVKYLIRSFKKVLKKFPDAILLIAGDGDFASLFKEAANIWSKIVFTGKVDQKKLCELYQFSDIGVVSSVHEEFGFVAVEMMMHGLPVVACDTGGLSEIIEDGISGLKVPVITRKGKRGINTTLLASKISFLLENNVLATEIGAAGRKKFLEKYEISVFRENIVSLYNSL